MSVALPVKSAPSCMRARAFCSVKLTSPTTDVPLSTPALLVKTTSAPPARVTVPPVIVPPVKRHEPVVPVSASVEPALFRLPVRLIVVAPVRLMPPRFNPLVLNVPPMFNVAPLARLIKPGLVQLPEKLIADVPAPATVPPAALDQLLDEIVSVAPLTALAVPLFVKVLGLTVRFWLARSAAIVPLL